MKAILPILLPAAVLLLAGGTAAAQQPVPQPAPQPTMPQTAVQGAPQPLTAQYALTLSAADSVPQQTVVPVQQAPVQIDETTTYYAVAPQMDRAERRRLQAKDFAARIDSLVRSHNYFFRARTMRELPAGCERRIYADFYYCAVTADHVELHLPTEQEAAKLLETVNFDSMSLRDYRASRLQAGWEITFCVNQENETYRIQLFVSTTTGEAQLTLVTPHGTMRYTGGLQG